MKQQSLHLGTEPTTQAFAFTRNQTGDLFVLWDNAQPTDPQWSGLGFFLGWRKWSKINYDDGYAS